MKVYKNVLGLLQTLGNILLMKLINWMPCTIHLRSNTLGLLLLREFHSIFYKATSFGKLQKIILGPY
uniref:NMDA receptor-regulated protein n=1 Tax=Rhizophora mucronata TaxID=61149 RepID=A0A2P2MTN5_RHIMU